MMSRKASEAQRWGAQHVVGIQSEQTPCTLLRKFTVQYTGLTMRVQEEQVNKVVIQIDLMYSPQPPSRPYMMTVTVSM